MKKIIIEITDDSVAVSSEDLKELTHADIAICFRTLISVAKMLGLWDMEGTTNGNAKVHR